MKHQTFRHRILFLTLVLILPLFSTGICAASDGPKTALAIMTRVDQRDDGDNQTSRMEMELTDRRGKIRKRTMRLFVKDRGPDILKRIAFDDPAEVRGTGFLSIDYDAAEKDDDQWIHLPSLHKTKRIASRDKSGSFMGSDLNYSDLTQRNLSLYTYTLLGEKEVRGIPVWIIQATPRTREEVRRTGYEKSILFVTKDTDMVLRSIQWEAEGGGRKKYVDVRQIEKINGILVSTDTLIIRKRGDRILHKTRLRLHDVRFGSRLPEALFTSARLEEDPMF